MLCLGHACSAGEGTTWPCRFPLAALGLARAGVVLASLVAGAVSPPSVGPAKAQVVDLIPARARFDEASRSVRVPHRGRTADWRGRPRWGVRTTNRGAPPARGPA